MGRPSAVVALAWSYREEDAEMVEDSAVEEVPHVEGEEDSGEAGVAAHSTRMTSVTNAVNVATTPETVETEVAVVDEETMGGVARGHVVVALTPARVHVAVQGAVPGVVLGADLRVDPGHRTGSDLYLGTEAVQFQKRGVQMETTRQLIRI